MTRHAEPAEPVLTQRIDKFLWFARLAKSRSLAAKLCAAGSVTVGGRPALKPNHALRVGDVVAVPQGRVIRTVRVAALGARRGPPTEARRLYSEDAPPQPIASNDPAWTRLLDEGEENQGLGAGTIGTLSPRERAG